MKSKLQVVYSYRLRLLTVCDLDGKPVDLDIIRREQKIGAAINHPGGNCIAEFRVDLDRGLGGLDFILARVDQVGRIENGPDTEPFPALHLE